MKHVQMRFTISMHEIEPKALNIILHKTHLIFLIKMRPLTLLRPVCKYFTSAKEVIWD